MRFLLSGGALPIAVLGLGIALLVSGQVARRDGDSGRVWRRTARVLWALSVAGVALLTLGLTNPQGSHLNLTPLATIGHQLSSLSPWMATFNIVGNMAVLVPFGLLARPAFGWRVLGTTVAGAGFSVVIEVVQSLTGRAGDVDDVLLNTVGALLGAAISALIVIGARRSDRHGRVNPTASTVTVGSVDDPAVRA